MKEDAKQAFFSGVFLFVVGCIFGYLFETVLCFFQFGKYESRKGLIYGPFNVIYGFAFVLAPLLLKKEIKHPIKVTLLSFCYGGIYEYLCSWIQETFFGTISWDYRNQLFNFDGRTSVFMMGVWAIIGVFFMYLLYPIFLKIIAKIKRGFYLPLAVSFTILMGVDIFLSSFAMIREQERLKGQKPHTYFDEWIDQMYPSSVLDEVYPHRMEPDTLKELRFNQELHQESS